MIDNKEIKQDIYSLFSLDYEHRFFIYNIQLVNGKEFYTLLIILDINDVTIFMML